MDHCLIAYCLLQYMIKFKKECIMSLKLVFTVKATLVETKHCILMVTRGPVIFVV